MEQPVFSHTSGASGTFSLENGLMISIQDKYLHNAEHFHSRGIYTSSPKDTGKNVCRSIACDSFKLKMTYMSINTIFCTESHFANVPLDRSQEVSRQNCGDVVIDCLWGGRRKRLVWLLDFWVSRSGGWSCRTPRQNTGRGGKSWELHEICWVPIWVENWVWNLWRVNRVCVADMLNR